MQGGAPNGLGGGGNPGMGGPPMGGNNQGNQSNMSGGSKTSTQVTIPKDVSPLNLLRSPLQSTARGFARFDRNCSQINIKYV